MEEVFLDTGHEDNSGSHEATIPERLGGMAKIFESQDTDVIVYSGNIGSPADREFVKKARVNRKSNKVLLLLATYGGVPSSAYRMARCLSDMYEHITIFVNDYCKSSGTLLSLVAHEIVMGQTGEFGPLDIQVLNKEEFNERNSGLDTQYSMQVLAQESTNLFNQSFNNVRMGGMLSTKQAIEAATNLTVGLLKPIYEQLEPLKIGEMTRLMNIASDYGQRLDVGNLKEGVLQRLIANYPEHGYVIDYQEAAESIFHNVREPKSPEQVLWSILDNIIQQRMGGNTPLILFLNEFIVYPENLGNVVHEPLESDGGSDIEVNDESGTICDESVEEDSIDADVDVTSVENLTEEEGQNNEQEAAKS